MLTFQHYLNEVENQDHLKGLIDEFWVKLVQVFDQNYKEGEDSFTIINDDGKSLPFDFQHLQKSIIIALYPKLGEMPAFSTMKEYGDEFIRMLDDYEENSQRHIYSTMSNSEALKHFKAMNDKFTGAE